jgi:hypothetical protein
MSALLQCCWLAAAARPARRRLCWPCSFSQVLAPPAAGQQYTQPGCWRWLRALAARTGLRALCCHPACRHFCHQYWLPACPPAGRCRPSSPHQRACSTLPARPPVLLAQLLTSACAAGPASHKRMCCPHPPLSTPSLPACVPADAGPASRSGL